MSADDINVQYITIGCITLLATVSVVTGLDKGIRRLSEYNFLVGLLLVFYLFFVGDTFYLLNLFVQGIGYHIQYLPKLLFHTDAFQQVALHSNEAGTDEFGQSTNAIDISGFKNN